MQDILSRKDVKSIKGYEGIYAISKDGEVWTLSRKHINNSGETSKTTKTRKLNTFLDGKKRYTLVGLSKNGKRTKYLLHRLVAEAFCKKEKNKEEVNHIDGDKKNNKANNLEWCTRKENIRHSIKNGLTPLTKGRAVVKIDKNGAVVAEYVSIREASRSMGKGMGNIANCCRGAVKSAYGYIWKYKENI